MPVKNKKIEVVKAEPVMPTVVDLGLDIGFGATKAVAVSKSVVFPSVCGYARDIKFRANELSEKHPGERITDDDGEWFVGDLALSHLLPGELLRLRGRTANEATMGNMFRARMAKAAMGKIIGGQNGEIITVRLATGLPVDHMPDAEELRNALYGQHVIRTDSANFVANVVEVMVMPQPYGTIYSQRLTEQGELNMCHTYTRVGVVDVGTYTVDLALDDAGEYVDAESGSIEGGVYMAQDRIAAALERDYRQKIPLKIVESVMRTNCFRAHGEPVDYSLEVQEALEPLRSATLGLISEKWKTGTTVDVIYLSGGGADLVKDVVTAAYKQTKVVPDSQLANARGYLNYALFAREG
jgi:plasmid segregation protein ParM